jgi:hypothetical protein
MIDRSHALSVARQARELGISRGSVYYLPRATSAADLAIMRRIDALHMDFPVRWQPDVARPACRRRHQGRPAARLHADEEDGDRGDLPAAEHLEACASSASSAAFSFARLGFGFGVGLGFDLAAGAASASTGLSVGNGISTRRLSEVATPLRRRM